MEKLVKNRIYTAVIAGYTHDALGVCEIEGNKVFVPGALKGEKCEILIVKAGNEISLNQLNAASKQIFIQVLLKVLRNLGDYNPPVMIDTVMGVLDEESRDALMEEYFPQLADQTILLCTTSEIRLDSDYKKLEPFVAKSFTLVRDVEKQLTTVDEGYFGLQLAD